MRKLNIILIIMLLMLSSTAYSQEYFKHEVSVGLGGGLSTLSYKTSFGDQKNGFGGLFTVGYHYFFTPEWAIGTGVDVALYNSKFDLKSVANRHSVDARDYQGATFVFSSEASDFNEKQQAVMLQIPIMAQYQFGEMYYVAGGGKIGLPLSKKYTGKGTFDNYGYFSAENYTYHSPDDRQMGFDRFIGKESDGDLDLKASFLLALEAGVKQIGRASCRERV